MANDRPRTALMAAAVVVVLLLGGVVLARLLSNHSSSPTASASRANTAGTVPSTPTGVTPSQPVAVPTATSPQPPPTVETSPPTPVTETAIDMAAVAANPYLPRVATLLDTYFTGINDHDAKRAASVFASDGAIDPRSSRQVELFGEGIRTTRDDRIVIAAITPAAVPGGRGLRVGVAFRSRQAPSLGPDGQSCTNWRLTYQMRFSSSGGLRLLTSTNVVHRSC